MINNIDFKIKNLAEIFKGKVIGNNNLRISGIGTIENAKKVSPNLSQESTPDVDKPKKIKNLKDTEVIKKSIN